MKRIFRSTLAKAPQRYLDSRQSVVDRKLGRHELNIAREWKSARQTKAIRLVVGVLRRMIGPRERCMYCLDSHACDVEHFFPKANFPERAFVWRNLLLCCTECGRLKGRQFPVAKGEPLLIDPTAEDPWRYLEFDPDTGVLTARFDIQANDWSLKGAKTVEVLQLDRREALENVYKSTFRRLSSIVQETLGSGVIDAPRLVHKLQDADDHGLLPWCFGSSGQTVPPFRSLHSLHPQEWAECVREIQSSELPN